jgi:hypothetical protein
MTKHYITGDVYYYTYSFTVAVGYNANTTYEEYRSRHSEYECDKCEHQANRSYQRMFVRGYKQFITFLCEFSDSSNQAKDCIIDLKNENKMAEDQI